MSSYVYTFFIIVISNVILIFVGSMNIIYYSVLDWTKIYVMELKYSIYIYYGYK